MRVLQEADFYHSGGRRSSQCKGCMRAAIRLRYADPTVRAARLAHQQTEEYKLCKRARRKQLRAAGDPQALGDTLRIRLCQVLSGKVRRTTSAVRCLGCPLPQFRSYLESKFLPGMSWENRGSVWEIDHIVPFHRVNLSDPEAQRKVCHYTNLRPLFKLDNLVRNRREVLDSELSELGLLLPDGTIRFPCDLVA